MSRIVGIDVGATLCKVVPFDAPDAAVHFRSDALDAVRRHVVAQAPAHVGATGGGTPALRAVLAGMPLTAVGEFEAWAAGVPILARAEGVDLPARYLLASVGTGTSILAMGNGAPTRVGGTAIGGGTFMGLGRLLIGESSFAALAALAMAGDRREVDLLVGDVYRDTAGPLVGDLTAANFAKLRSERPADLAAALANLVGETVALMSVAHAERARVDTIVYCGSTLAGNPALVGAVADITRRFGATPRFLRAGPYGGALGAAAVAQQEKDHTC